MAKDQKPPSVRAPFVRIRSSSSFQLRTIRSGTVVSREELIQQVWEGVFVTDEVLTQSVSELRKALNDETRKPRFIQTIPKQGYRLIVPVGFS